MGDGDDSTGATAAEGTQTAPLTEPSGADSLSPDAVDDNRLASGWWRRTDDCRVRLGAHVEVRLEGEVLVVFAGGLPISHLHRRDQPGLRVLLATLEAEGAIRRVWVVRSRLVASATFERDCAAFKRGGAEEIRRAIGRRGGRPRKLVPVVLDQIRRLHAGELSTTQIGMRMGLGASTVRGALHDMRAAANDGVQLPLAVANDVDASDVAETADVDPPGSTDASEAELASPPQPECAPAVVVATDPVPLCAVAEPVVDLVDDSPTVEAFATPAESLDDASPIAERIVVLPVNDGRDVDPILMQRAWEQLECRLGWREEQSALFAEAAFVPHAGALLGLVLAPTLELIAAARRDIGALPNGFYGLRSMFTALVLMALLRCKRPEQLKGFNPAALGAVIGLARMPEMKTVRRKLRLLAAERASIEMLVRDMAKVHATRCHDALGCLYVDGHVRAYFGAQRLPKTHHTTLRTALKATTDYWTCAKDGSPLSVLTTEGNAAMTKTMPTLLTAYRELVGPTAEPTIAFDRGGFCAETFRVIRKECFHFITYRKGKAKPIPKKHFSTLVIERAGKVKEVKVADRTVTIKGFGKLRCIAVLRDDGKQTHILTSHLDGDPKTLLETMFGRWVQENFFRYMTVEFDFNALWTYRAEAADPDRSVPNPARKDADREIQAVRRKYARVAEDIGKAERADRPYDVQHHSATKRLILGLLATSGGLSKKIARLVAKRKEIPLRVPVGSLSAGDVKKLQVAPHLLTDVVKMTAYHIESLLASVLEPHLLRAPYEARATVADFMNLPGAIHREGSTVIVTLSPAAAPRYTRALIAICEHVNGLQPVFPETTTPMRFRVRLSPVEAEALQVAA